jgi:DNA helicase-2/ATP-dependent DNA helicase PcrA
MAPLWAGAASGTASAAAAPRPLARAAYSSRRVQPSPPSVRQTREPSAYQRRILAFVETGRGHGVVSATAGAGKTSTLVMVAKSLPPGVRSCFLAFGAEAARELARRLPADVPAMTVHKLGRRTLLGGLARGCAGLRGVDRSKYGRIIQGLVSQDDFYRGLDAAALRECRGHLAALVRLARLDLVEPSDEERLADLVDRHGLVRPAAVPSTPGALRAAFAKTLTEVLTEGVKEALKQGIIDFTDMLWVPVSQHIDPPRFDFVCVDEAQDYSVLALEFTRRLVDERSGGRLLFVGDPRQGIYGFAGADPQALARIARETGASVFPLSVTYRCPRSHVDLARLLAPEIEPGPGAGVGRVFWISDQVLEYWALEGDLMLCRANAPLVGACLRLIRAGKRAFVRGRDLGEQLEALARRALPDGSIPPDGRLERFAAAEEKRLRGLLAGRPHLHAVLAERRDLLDSLRFLAHDARSDGPGGLDTLLERISRIFEPSGKSIVLSTVHRAKGQEAERVHILYPELMPAPYARTAQAVGGESCVQFVALTRARRDLIFVSATPISHPGRDQPGRGGRDESEPGSGHVRGTNPAGRRDPAPRHALDAVGQGPGPWREVLEQARKVAQRRR